MIRSALVVAAGVLGAFAVIAAVYGLQGGLETAALLAGVGAIALVAAHWAAARRRRLGRLGRQFSLAVAIAVGQLLAVVVAFIALMFVSTEDAVLTGLTVAFAGVIAIRGAQLLAGGVLRDVEAVSEGLVAAGAGERDLQIETGARDEIAQLAAAANTMVQRLAASEATRRDLVAAVSHDLRTPITSLRLLVDAVGDDIVDETTRRRYLETMSTHLRALSGLIDDLFELSRLEAGDIEWSMEQVRLDELVDETVSAMRVHGEAGAVRVVAEVPGDLAPARANPEKVQRVLFNLIQNAIRHTPADGSVTIRARPTADAVEVEVADTGDGIAADERERVFEPFFRGGADGLPRTQTAEQRTDGARAGLGLAISRAIIEAHGGRIWLEESGVGTRVRFSLPRAV